QPDLLAVDPACGIEIFCCLSRTAPVLLAKRSIGPGMRTGNADNHVGLSARRNTQRDADREGQKAFSVSLLRHGLLLLKWKCCVVVEQVTCSDSSRDLKKRLRRAHPFRSFLFESTACLIFRPPWTF